MTLMPDNKMVNNFRLYLKMGKGGGRGLDTNTHLSISSRDVKMANNLKLTLGKTFDLGKAVFVLLNYCLFKCI